MKKAIRNYLAKLQDNEKKGFSLVELIIVMAIMAILVGVVASQVIPYLEKSRVAKDTEILNNVSSDLVLAVTEATANGTVADFEITLTAGASGITGAETAGKTVTADITAAYKAIHDGATDVKSYLAGLSYKSDEMKKSGNVCKIAYDNTNKKLTITSQNSRIKIESSLK